jgi:hypothetical protein
MPGDTVIPIEYFWFSKSSMKYTFYLIVGLVLVLCNVSCSSSNEADNSGDTAYTRDQMNHDYFIETLLGMKDEVALVANYGKDAVSFDTIWGAEGFFSMGTILKTEEGSHIEITWMDETKRERIVSVTLVSDQDWYSDSINHGQWKSNSGVMLGMPIEELQKLNGRPFTFSGFGWDYAGSVLDWQKGNLEGKGIAVQLSEGATDENLSDTEAAHVLGDVMVQSDDPTALKFHPRVWSISVAKVR